MLYKASFSGSDVLTWDGSSLDQQPVSEGVYVYGIRDESIVIGASSKEQRASSKEQ
ncbi:hypothetical protein ACFLT1_03205 [Bacteroidota bacterium]